MEGMSSIYADDATVQSPLVPTFFGPGKGIARGKAEVLLFLKESVRRRPEDKVHWYRDGFVWNGKTLIWEYRPRPRMGTTKSIWPSAWTLRAASSSATASIGAGSRSR